MDRAVLVTFDAAVRIGYHGSRVRGQAPQQKVDPGAFEVPTELTEKRHYSAARIQKPQQKR